MSRFGGKISSFVWWTYPRGSIEYDIMVAVILAFIFLTPRGFFHDQPRTAPAPMVVQAAGPTLPQVLAALDRAAPGVRTVAAQAEVTDFTALVNDSSRSRGTLYFERGGGQPSYALDLTQPAEAAKRLVYRDRIAWVYTPASHQVVKYVLGNRQNLLNQFLLLGMGATGADLERSFTVKLDAPAHLDNITAVCLGLTPKDRATAEKIPSLEICYDPATWVSVEQRIAQPGGDYHQVNLSRIRVNGRLPGNAFSTDFHGAAVATPGG